MPKDNCPFCEGLKDTRAKRCLNCVDMTSSGSPVRLGTGKGWQKTALGYIASCINGKYVLQHRYVMEQFLGRKLKTYEHIHHVDRDKGNNIISNLKLMSHSEHAKTIMTSEQAKERSVKGHKARWGYVSNLCL